MKCLDTCSPEEIRAFAEWVNRLKHDLGKYIRFRQAWLPAQASLQELRAALIADVQHTRRGPEGTMDAWTVWREFRPKVFGEVVMVDRRWVFDDLRIRQIDGAMNELHALEPLEEASDAQIERAAQLCTEVAEGVRSLAHELRGVLVFAASEATPASHG